MSDVHVQNNSKSNVTFFSKAADARVSLKPGTNRLDEATYKFFARQIAEDVNLSVLHEMNDVHSNKTPVLQEKVEEKKSEGGEGKPDSSAESSVDAVDVPVASVGSITTPDVPEIASASSEPSVVVKEEEPTPTPAATDEVPPVTEEIAPVGETKKAKKK